MLLVAYVVTARIGFLLHVDQGFAMIIWPPTSVALVAIFFWGYELWPGVLLGSFVMSLSIGVSVPIAVGIAIGSTLEVLTGVYFLRDIVMLNPMLGRLRDAIGLLATCVSFTVVSASVGVVSLALGGVVATSDMPQAWFAWWLSDSLAALILVPFLIRWVWRPLFSRTPSEFLEGLAALGLLVVADGIAFWSPLAKLHVVPLAYIMAPLLWISLRLGPRGITLANLLTAVFALSSTYFGRGIFTQGTTNENIFLTQGFIGVVTAVFFIFASSVEERKETERTLEGHIGHLESVVERVSSEDQAKSDFLAILAHELRNPLAPIVSAIEMVRINGVRPENAKLFNTIEEQVRTMGRLLDDLLDISRISHKKLVLQKESVELQSVLTHALETVSPFARSRQHTLTTAYPDHPVWVYGDPLRLAQIFVNILYNAAKYTNPGGTITLTSSSGRGVVRVAVADTGMGIEPHMLKKIFEPFVQGTDSSSLVGTGLGVGLALTKQLVELHGGSITVASDGKDKGSVFTVTLPVSRQPAKEIPSQDMKTSTGSQTLRLLIVDDNEIAAQGLRTLLEHRGHTVAIALSGAEALTYANTHSHLLQAVLLDIGLPDMSGYEVAKRLRTNYGTALLLIALSGYGQKEDKDKALAAGFNHHLTKPARVTDIDALLQNHLKSL